MYFQYMYAGGREKAAKIGWRRVALNKFRRDMARALVLLRVATAGRQFRMSFKDGSVLARQGEADEYTFNHIFVNEGYAGLDFVADPKVIVDCGANVGYSAVYFLNKYPNVQVVAIEPDPSNFAMLRKNTAPFGERIKLIHAGVWSKSVPLVVDHSRGWSTRIFVREAGLGEKPDVNAVDLESVFNENGLTEVDILKVDIEGCELQLFSENVGGWLPRVRNLAVELHDSECRKMVTDAVASRSLESFEYDEYTVFRLS